MLTHTKSEIEEYQKYCVTIQTMEETINLIGMDLAKVANVPLCHHLSEIEIFHPEFPARFRAERKGRIL